MKRVEAPGRQPFALSEAIARTLRELALTPRRPPPPPPPESAADQLASGNFDAWFNLGLARNEAHQYGKDIEAYDRALALKPNDAATWNNKGIALRDLQRLDEALAAYDRALALGLGHDTSQAWRGKAKTLRGLGREAEAQEAARRAQGAERRAQELGG